MITWISNRIIAGPALVLSLMGCSAGEGRDVFGMIGAALPQQTAPLRQVTLTGGDVTIVAPQGYCVDPASLRRSFALLARCDVLGADGGSGGAPLGVITVSLTRAQSSDAPLPTPAQKAAALGLTDIQDPTATDTAVVFRAMGAAPSETLSQRHWRGIARVNDQVLGAAFYRATATGGGTAAGRAVMLELIARTQEANE